MAAAVLHSPIGAVNFVDGDRHYSKAIVGVPGGQGTSVPAHLSFCAATIDSAEGALWLPDTGGDERWREHPLVTGGPRVGFYAGVSIRSRGERVGVVCAFGKEPHTISDRERGALAALARQTEGLLEARLRHAHLLDLAVTDPLTGLANRRHLFDVLQGALDQQQRSGEHVAVLFCDVDDFKSINDKFGHETGDRLLCQVADGLRELTRSTDTVSRIAGDEFVLVYPSFQVPERFESWSIESGVTA
jgi:GAF domain-containing protein